MEPAIDYKAIVDELRRRLLNSDKGIKDRIRSRLAGLLDTDPDTPMDVVISKLDEKWRRDGLIQEHNELDREKFSHNKVKKETLQIGGL